MKHLYLLQSAAGLQNHALGNPCGVDTLSKLSTSASCLETPSGPTTPTGADPPPAGPWPSWPPTGPTGPTLWPSCDTYTLLPVCPLPAGLTWPSWPLWKNTSPRYVRRTWPYLVTKENTASRYIRRTQPTWPARNTTTSWYIRRVKRRLGSYWPARSMAPPRAPP